LFLDFTAEKAHSADVKKQIIKSFLIGIGITAFGGVIFFIDASLYDLPTQSGTFVDVCLRLFMFFLGWPVLAVEWLLKGALGDMSIAVLLVLTAFFWGIVVHCFTQANTKAKGPPEIPAP
jgi:hypothetical protein